jgi:hypothetical protein
MALKRTVREMEKEKERQINLEIAQEVAEAVARGEVPDQRLVMLPEKLVMFMGQKSIEEMEKRLDELRVVNIVDVWFKEPNGTYLVYFWPSSEPVTI